MTHAHSSARWKRGHVVLFLLIFALTGCGKGHSSFPYQWTVESTHRWAELPAPGGDGPGFQRLDSTDTGVGFVNTVGKKAVARNKHLLHGSGVAVGDVNGDDRPDLFLARLEGPNALYLNRGGFRFEKVPLAGGAALPEQYSTGVVLEDVTGNGAADLLVTTLGGANLVFRNDAQEGFGAVDTLHAGRGSTTMALADVNGNEALDLYVTNYKRKALSDSLGPEELAWEEVVRQVGPDEYEIVPAFQDEYELRTFGTNQVRLEQAEADRIYFNNGTGTFVAQSWTDTFQQSDATPTKEIPRDWGLTARFEDLNGDGTPDLYVCNDFESPDFYYRGMPGERRFREAPEEALRTTSHSSMSIATTDVERTGTVDFFVADMLGQSYERRQQQVGTRAPIPREIDDETARKQEMRNTLQMNRGDGTYVDVAQIAGVEASGWTWSSRFLDVTLNGYEDLIVSNGHAFDVQDADAQTRVNRYRRRLTDFEKIRRTIFRYPRLDQKNAAFRNERDGTFRKMADGWGLGKTADVSHGMATGDFDGDGDLDVVINRLNRPVGVYRNEGTGPRVAVRLAGRSPNTGGIGAEVEVEPEGGSVPVQETSVIAGGEYVSDSGGTLSFAMGEAEAATIRVEWSTGEETEIEGAAGRIYEVKQPGADPGWNRVEEEKADSTAL